MGVWLYIIALLVRHSALIAGTRVWLDDRGRYQNIVVGVHPALSSYNCTELFTNLQHVATRFSSGLLEATDGKASIGRLQVVLPPAMAQTCHLNHLPYADWQRWATADIRLVPGPQVWERWGPYGSSGVGVKQVQSCTRPGDFITLDAALLTRRDNEVDLTSNNVMGRVENDTLEAHNAHPLELENSVTENPSSAENDVVELIGLSLVAGWARYRWGVFEERGYMGDPHFPLSLPCQLHPTNCTSSPITSIMQAIDAHQGVKFCDAENHNHEGRNLHNLACSGRSVAEVIQHHDDLAVLYRAPRKSASPEVIRPYSGPEVIDHDEYHVEGEINLDLTPTPAVVNASVVSNNGSELQESESDLFKHVSRTDKILKKEQKSEKNEAIALVNWQLQRKKRAMERDEEFPLYDTAEKFVVFSSSNDSELSNLPLLNTNKSASENATKEFSFDEEQVVLGQELLSNRSDPEVSSAISTTLAPTHQRSVSSERWPPAVGAIRPQADGFDGVPLELLVAPPSVVVVSLDLSQAAIDEVGVETLRGGLLRWMWGLGGSFRLSILASYNNESFPLTLSPLPPSPSTARQLMRSVALLPTPQEAASGVFGGQYCLSCGIKQAAEIIAQGGASVDSATVIVAACRPEVGSQERRMLESSGFVLHTIALCPAAPAEFDELASPHASWTLPLSHGPKDGERRLAMTLQSIMSVSAASPLEPRLVQLHDRGRSFERSELRSSGAYQLASGRLHLGTSSSERLLVLSSTSSAKVVEIRDGDGRRLETTRDTGKRFWVEVTTSGEVTYTFKFLTTSLSFPLFITEDVYERHKSQAGAEIHLRTSNLRHEALVPGSPPVVVWADVTMDGWPLVGADVTLTVTHLPSGTSSNYSLLDSGNTEPDMRAGDGVYSRYLTRQISEGRYSLVATARQGPSTTVVTLLPDGSVRQSSSGPFFCKSSGRTVYVRRVSFDDTAPPSRVTDLAAHLVGDPHQALVNLSWSAPGGELDHATASAYELKMYTEWEALTEERFNTSGISVYCVHGGQSSAPPSPSPYGTPQHCLVSVPFTDLKWHFAIRGLDSSNNTGRVSNIASIDVPKPVPVTPAAGPSSSSSAVLLSVESELTSNVSVTAAGGGGGEWRPYVVAGAAVMGLLMVVAATIACICCCKRAKMRKEKDPDRPVYKIYVNNAYIQEDDGEIKVVSNGRFTDEKRSGQVQEWVNSLDKYGNPETGEGIVDGTELKNKTSFKYTSPVRFGVLTNGSIMRDATTGSNSSGSSRPSDAQPHDDYKYKDLSETTSDSTTDGLPPSSSSSAATDLPPVPQRDCSPLPPPVDHSPRAKSSSFKNTNISSLPLPSPLKNPPPTPPSSSAAQLSLAPLQPNDYTSEEEGGFRPRASHPPLSRGSPIPVRRQLSPQFCSFRYLPPPPQYRTDEEHFLSQHQKSNSPHRSCVAQPSPPAPALSRVSGSLSHGTVRSVKKRRHISFV